MSDQAAPPNPATGPPVGALPVPTDPEAGALDALYKLIDLWTGMARTVKVPQEADDWGKALLSLAQAAAVIDPARLVGGDHPVSRLAAAPEPAPTPPRKPGVPGGSKS